MKIVGRGSGALVIQRKRQRFHGKGNHRHRRGNGVSQHEKTGRYMISRLPIFFCPRSFFHSFGQRFQQIRYWWNRFLRGTRVMLYPPSPNSRAIGPVGSNASPQHQPGSFSRTEEEPVARSPGCCSSKIWVSEVDVSPHFVGRRAPPPLATLAFPRAPNRG